MAPLPLVALALALQQAPPAVPSSPALPEVRPPFGCGLAFPVSQAHDTGSHRHADTWAWDFRMPEGTPITAAADGRVRLARGDSVRGGCDEAFAPDANYVVLRHGDGTETQYLHFLSVVVKAGQEVKAGELLGYAGRTGWACGAHLHFKVTRAGGAGWNNDSIPARIAGYGDPAVDAWVEAGPCAPEPPPGPRWVHGPGQAQGVPAVALPPVP